MTKYDFFLVKSVSHLVQSKWRWEKIWWKSWYHLASSDVSEGYVHIKFEVSLLETKIEHCRDAQLALVRKTDCTNQFSIRCFVDRHSLTVNGMQFTGDQLRTLFIIAHIGFGRFQRLGQLFQTKDGGIQGSDDAQLYLKQ